MTKVGQLFVIATPIGNLDDITKRAVDVLKSVDFIAAENARVTGIILQRFNISTPIVPYHDFSDEKARERIVLSLMEGKSVGLVLLKKHKRKLMLPRESLRAFPPTKKSVVSVLYSELAGTLTACEKLQDGIKSKSNKVFFIILLLINRTRQF